MDLTGQKLLRIEYIPLNRVAKWDKNPKKHDLPRLIASIQRYGFRDAVIFDGTLGSLVAGHGRAAALEAIQNQGEPPPDGVAFDSSGLWYIPVQFGNDAESRAVAEAFALDHNNLTVMDSGFDASLLWDAAGYADVLRGLADGYALPVTVDAETAGRLLGLNGSNGQTAGDEEFDPGEQPDLLAPFPYFGGKARVAAKVWARLGQVENYIEPFCGSAAVLLACPFDISVVTLNDIDGFIANFWRAVAYAPADVARWVDWPVNEVDLLARHIWLVERRAGLVQSLEANPAYYDAKIAGWWCWGACAWIGTGWCSGDGPWSRNETGEIIKNGKLSGVSRQLPHLTGNGQGVNRKPADRGDGVSRRVPQVGDAGQGVNRKIPTTGSGGERRSLSFPDSGVSRQIPVITGGRGVHRLSLGEGFEGNTCEAITAHLQTYIQTLSDKLRRARVTCGDWARVTTPSVTFRHGLTAILFDPPYGEGEQEYSAGGNQDKTIAEAVWKWARENGHNPDLRIAVCGYNDGRETPPGWSVLRWKAPGGYGRTEAAVENSRRECIWFSPHCLGVATALKGDTEAYV